MSIMNKKFSRGLFFLLFVQCLSIFCSAQNIEINISLASQNPSEINIKGKFSQSSTERNLLFLLNRADSDNLGARISGVELFDANDRKIGYRKIADGSFVAEKIFDSFSYRIKTEIPTNVLSIAHISWTSGDKGVLRLEDLLPIFETKYKAKVSINFPPNWKIATTEKSSNRNTFEIRNAESATFIIGKNWNEQTFSVSGANIKVILDEKWKLEKSTIEKIVREILLKYESLFGAIPQKNLQIVNFNFPKDVGFDRWRAETFGENILIMSAPTVFESQMRQRFQEQLRHELFHLWMPNDLALDGNYSWFYEGFAQYSALKSGVELNQISFDDFLNTLEQSYNLANRRSQPISLIEASKNRWLGENSSVYAKGLAIAFLFDVALLRQSSGKRNLFFLLKQIYEKHKKPNKQEDGNAAILSLSANYKELSPIVEDYVKGAKKLDFEKYLQQTGIEILPSGANIKLRTKNKPTRGEKDFLNKLGYNNWRKIL